MVVGIGGFRDIGDPNDPRRRRGPAPQQRNLPGLIAGPLQDNQLEVDIARYIARKGQELGAQGRAVDAAQGSQLVIPGLPPEPPVLREPSRVAYSQENLPGLFVGPSQLGSRTDRDIERYVARKAMQRAAATPETIPQPAPPQGLLNLPGSQGDVVNLGESLLAALNAPAPATNSAEQLARSIVQGEPGYYRDIAVQRRVTPVGEGSSLLDRKVRRVAESTGFDPRNREESPINPGTIQGLYDSEDPVDQELYNEYVRGIAAASDTVDLEANNNLRYGQFTAVDPTTGSLTAKQAFDPAPFGTVDIPVVQRTGQFAIPSGKNKGQREIAKIDPTAIAYTEENNPDSPYTRDQEREVRVGTMQMEAKRDLTTPVIVESGLNIAAQEGRFIPLNKIPPQQYEKYLTKEGDIGNLVGMMKLDMSPAKAEARFPEGSILVSQATGKVYAPVYAVTDRKGNPVIKQQDIPSRDARFTETEQYPQRLYRIGNPFKGDSDKVRQQVAPYVGVRNVKVPDPKKKQILSANRVRQAAKQGYQFFSGPEMTDKQLLDPQAVTGANKVFMRRSDGTTTQLTPHVVPGRDDEGNIVPRLTGNYRIDDAYITRQVGPASYTEGGARYGVEIPGTQVDIRDRNTFVRGILGPDAIAYKEVDADMVAGHSMADRTTANAYRDILAPKLLSGEITIEQLEQAAPGLRPGTYARQLLDEAVQEVAGREQIRADRYLPRFLGYGDLSPAVAEREFTEKYGFDASDLAMRDEIETGEDLETPADGRSGTFEDEEEVKAGDSRLDKGEMKYFSNSQYEGVPDTRRERKLKAKVLEMLQERMDDSAAQGVSPAMTNEGQAAYLADVIRRNVGEGGQVRLGNLLGGEVRTSQVAPPPEEAKARGQEPGEFLNAPRKQDAFLMAARRKFGL